MYVLHISGVEYNIFALRVINYNAKHINSIFEWLNHQRSRIKNMQLVSISKGNKCWFNIDNILSTLLNENNYM